MDKDKRIEHLETMINGSFEYLGQHFHSYYWHLINDFEGGYDRSLKSLYDSQISIEIQNLYYYIICYLEMLGLTHYLEMFKRQFEERIISNKDLEKFEPCIPVGVDGFEEDFVVLEEFRRHLYSFPFFGSSHEKTKESIRLKSILEETKNIIDFSKCEINRETDIINQVSRFLYFYFPQSIHKPKNSKSRFIAEFKIYEPDILIPELNTAIEYKYIQKNTKSPDDYIDEIYVDSTNYIGDPHYDRFIAVICLKNGVEIIKDRIKKSWNKKRFPKNWELIIVQNL